MPPQPSPSPEEIALTAAVIKSVRVRSSGRTRYEGSKPYEDEILVAEIDRLQSERTRAEEKIAELTRELAREEKSHENTIDQRDSAELALGAAYGAVIGRAPEWSNLFGYSHAILEIEDALAGTAAVKAELTTLVDAYREEDTRWNEGWARLEATVTEQAASIVVLREALEHFCRRVEEGEIRSIKTYAHFKKLLSTPPSEAAENIKRLIEAATWKPIADIPEELKDGRHILLACDKGDGLKWVAEGFWEEDANQGWYAANTHWTDSYDGSLPFATHWVLLPSVESLKPFTQGDKA
jgi:hypothetical protein